MKPLSTSTGTSISGRFNTGKNLAGVAFDIIIKSYSFTLFFFLILCIQADELDPLSDYLKGKILFAKIKSKTISTTTSTSHIVDDTFGDTLGEKIILAGIGSFVTAVTSYIFVCLYKFLRNERHFKKNWFIPKIHQYHPRHQQEHVQCAETIVELIAMGPSSSNNEL
ncbi:unnamed protein product, partial [Rotaria magnacalcarata]